MDGRCQDEYLHGTSLAGRRAGEYHFSMDQEPCSSVSFGRRGRVLPAHMRKGLTRVSQHGVVSLSCFVGFVGLVFFLFDCPLLILAGIALLGLALPLAFLSCAVRILVSAVLDRTLRVSYPVGSIWESIGHSGCVVR